MTSVPTNTKQKRTMKILNLTPEEYQALMNPTRKDRYTGEHYKVAKLVQAQIMALADERTRLDDFDIYLINKAIEVNGIGCFIATPTQRCGGWPTPSDGWDQSIAALRRAVNRSDWTE